MRFVRCCCVLLLYLRLSPRLQARLNPLTALPRLSSAAPLLSPSPLSSLPLNLFVSSSRVSSPLSAFHPHRTCHRSQRGLFRIAGWSLASVPPLGSILVSFPPSFFNQRHARSHS